MTLKKLPAERLRPRTLIAFREDAIRLISESSHKASRKSELKTELESQAFFALFASVEGLLRLHQLQCCDPRYNDDLAITLRGAQRSAGGHISIESILDAWIAATGNALAIGKFKNYVRLRNWLAHGRVGGQPKNVKADCSALFAVAQYVAKQVNHWPDPSI